MVAPAWCGRADFPVLRGRKRGCKRKAFEVAADASRLAAARRELEKDMVANSTRPTKENKRAFAEGLARAAGHTEVYPLSPEVVLDVAAALKEADYASGHSYLLELRARHQDLGYDIGSSLKRLFGRCQASIERGLGGVLRAAVVELALFNSDGVAESDDDRSLVLAVWFLLREIELSFTRLHRSHVQVDGGKVTWRLPVSKRDPAGRGAVRSWRCICGQTLGARIGVVTERVCPACVMIRQIRYAEVLLGVTQDQQAALVLPLFPNDEGGDKSKKQVVAGWRSAIKKRWVDGDGDPPVPTGHTARRTGAHALARLKWARWQIQFLAGHSSGQVDTYVWGGLQRAVG